MLTALLFPGQGAPAAGWHETVAERVPDLLELATDLVGEDPFERVGCGTEFDQPAIYCTCLAAYEIAGRPKAAFHAGHSLGELAALACAGALTPEDGLRVAVERGRLTAEAGRGGPAGSMLAVRAPADELEQVAAANDVSIANFNSPSQTVLSGGIAGIEAVERELNERGLLVKRLKVSGAFHSPQMQPAAQGLSEVLATIEFSEPSVPVISGRTAKPFFDPPSELVAALTEPVRWIEVVGTLVSAGVERWVEVGPGRALAGLVKKSIADPAGAIVEAVAIPEPTRA